MDRVSFIAVYQQTVGPLRRYVARTIGNADAADDIVQETFARALRSVGFPREPSEARAYLFRVASNLMKDQWRRYRATLEQEDGAQTEGVAGPGDPAMRVDLAQLFAKLGLRERQLIWLAHVEGADHAAIGRALGLREGSVKVLLHRAREKFAKQLRVAGYSAGGGDND